MVGSSVVVMLSLAVHVRGARGPFPGFGFARTDINALYGSLIDVASALFPN